MATEPVSTDNSSTTLLALIVGGLVVAAIAFFAFGAFDNGSPETTSITIDAPSPAPAPSGN